MEFISRGEKETQKLAQILGKEIMKKPLGRRAVVLGLEGELGAGKTTFVKGFAKGLGIKEKVTSPTFILMRVYGTKGNVETKRYLYHFDCYRLKDYRDLNALGVQEFLSNPRNIVLIEWSDRVKKVLPERYQCVHIDHLDKKTRKITIQK